MLRHFILYHCDIFFSLTSEKNNGNFTLKLSVVITEASDSKGKVARKARKNFFILRTPSINPLHVNNHSSLIDMQYHRVYEESRCFCTLLLSSDPSYELDLERGPKPFDLYL